MNVLVTGCSTGIGRALAAELHARGHRTFATARRPETLVGLVPDTLALDVTDAASIDAAVDEMAARAGSIDMVVNNAGINAIGPLAEQPVDDIRRIFDTNCVGPIAVAHAAFRHMAAQRRGRIVNLGSVVGVVATPYAGAYCASKTAVHVLSEVLRVEVAPFGIDVIVVQPGAIRSHIADTASTGLERYSGAESRYRSVFEHIRRRAGASQVNPTPAEDFAREVVAAITRKRAPRVVRAGRGSRALPALRRLPDRLLDRIMSRQFGLDELE